MNENKRVPNNKQIVDEDNRFWSLAVDEQDKGQAIVRLLLDKNGVPFVNLKTIGLKAFDEVNKKWAWFIL